MPPNHSVQDLQDEIDRLKQDESNYIANRDAADVGLKQAVKDAAAQHVTDQAQLDNLNAGIDAAFTKVDEARALVAPPANLPPPTVLVASYPDAASFNTAVAGYTGPEEVDLDGAPVRSGSTPALTYTTQGDGSITSGTPTL